MLGVCAGLYLHKHQRILNARHKIRLSVTRAISARQYFIPMGLQILRRQLFSQQALLLIIVYHVRSLSKSWGGAAA